MSLEKPHTQSFFFGGTSKFRLLLHLMWHVDVSCELAPHRQARKESLRKQLNQEEARQEWQEPSSRLDVRRQEKGCTFRPKCNPSKLGPRRDFRSIARTLKVPRPKDGHVEIQTPPGSTRSEAKPSDCEGQSESGKFLYLGSEV